MEAKELRIGNYLTFKGSSRVNVKLDRFDLSAILYNEDEVLHYEPIQLTEEILLKCGFTLMGIIFRINNGLSHQFDINYSPSRGIFYYDSSKYAVYTEVEIKYLHQLQNLYFALTNEELNIQL